MIELLRFLFQFVMGICAFAIVLLAATMIIYILNVTWGEMLGYEPIGRIYEICKKKIIQINDKWGK